MLEYVLCHTCGNNVGSVHLAFSAIKTERYRKFLIDNKNSINISNINLIDHLGVSMEDVFEDLHITNICCKQILTTNSTFCDAKYN